MRPNDVLKLVLACLVAFLLVVFAPASLIGSATAQSMGNEVNQENNAEADTGGGGQSGSGDTSNTEQSGGSASGDAVAGQVFGSVSAGDVSGDATNRSSDVDVESGDSAGFNIANNFVGQGAEGVGSNEQIGNNELELTQRADAVSGDAVGGQVIGVVTASGGSADIVAANTSEEVDISTGDALSSNDADVFVGLLSLGSVGDFISIQQNQASFTDSDNNTLTQTNDVTATILGGANTQQGDNEADLAQTASAISGDGVGGQVIGVVSVGDTSVDATNRSSDVNVETGDAESDNDSLSFTGLLADGEIGDVTVNQLNDAEFTDSDDNTVTQSNTLTIDVAGASNSQTGDNTFDQSQAADATSGDGVGGQVIGVVTSSGGSADVVAANSSDDVDVTSGEAESTNDSDVFVGLLAEGEVDSIDVSQTNITDIIDGDVNTVTQSNLATISGTGASNTQDGDNEFDSAQNASAASGDGVGGQVIGVVSAGDTSVDATNRSSDVDTTTGDAESFNDVEAFVGLLSESSVGDLTIDQSNTATIIECTGSVVNQSISSTLTLDAEANEQDGDNQHEMAQSANAFSGDGVGGQVVGVVTSSGGTADVVAANDSTDVDLESGESDQANDDESFVGLQIESEIGERSQESSNTALFDCGGVD